MNTATTIPAARSQLLQLLALGFTHPVPALHRILQDDSYGLALASASAQAQCGGHFSYREARDFASFEADYIHQFQMGRGGKPIVSLNAGDHDSINQGQGRPEFLLQYSAWYRHFGLRTNQEEDANELPDHLVCQLEFMAWLAHLEDEAALEPELEQGYQLAQRDFLQRHLLPFLEVLAAQIQQRARGPTSSPFYLSLAARSLAATHNMLQQLEVSLAVSGQADTSGGAEQIAAVNLWD